MNKMEGSGVFLIEERRKPKARVISKQSIFMKIIELLLASACLMTYSMSGGQCFLPCRYAVANATFGTFVIIGTIALIGYLLAQPMPRILEILCDSVAFILFVSSGMLLVESWWQYELKAGEGSIENMDAEERRVNVRLLVGLLSLCTAAFHLADAFVNTILAESR